MMISNDERQAVQDAQAKRERANHLGRKLRFEGTRMACPMCEAQSEIKTSYVMSKTLRESFYQCTNLECGCTFVLTAEISRILNLGSTPNPKVNIPVSKHVRRDLVRVVLDNASEADHQTRFTLPVTGDLFASGGSS